MLIFGKTSDDKGRQLEVLTSKLLQQLGYRNCTSNYISAGGSEVDARAEFEIPQLHGRVTREILCECKAHRSPIAMTDWQKFLGKVFSAEILAGHEVAGTFIALSGVNGNVKGSYDDLRHRKDNLCLVTGDDLFKLLEPLFNVISLEEVNKVINRMTQRVVKQLDVAYYEGECYWIAVFSGGSFCLLTAAGKIVGESIAAQLADLVGKEIEVTSYVDLAKEAEAQNRVLKAQSWCLGQLMINGGEIADSEFPRDSQFSDEEINTSLTVLASSGMVVWDNGSVRIPILEREGIAYISSAVYRAMLTRGCPLEAIGCKYYDCHINEAMLSHLLEVQCNVPLSENERLLALRILLVSPTALVRLSEPIAMITTHRNGSSSQQWDKADRDILFNTLHESLSYDFMNRELAPYIYKVRNLRELETRTQLLLKASTGVDVDDTIRTRNAIGELDDSLGGGFGHIWLIDEVPEPWEEGGIGVASDPPTNSVEQDEFQE